MIEDGKKLNRIASIDALRGFDMLFIIFLDHFFQALNVGVGSPFTKALAKQFDHPEWFGSSVYDIVMPLFLFIVGAAIPFALSKRKLQDSRLSALYAKLIKRFVILFYSRMDRSGAFAGI
jgi:predicted acyltransferase